MRQRTETMRAVADLADAGNVRAAIEVMGARVIETSDRIGAAAAAWLALSPERRTTTTLLPLSRDGRARANALIQTGLKQDGVLVGPGRTFNVREQVNLTHEELRFARNWKQAQFLEVGDNRNPFGLARGDYRIDAVCRDGRIMLSDQCGRSHRIDPM